MFTGIVERTGTIVSLTDLGGVHRLTVAAPGIAGRHRHTRVVQAASQRPVLDDELDLEPWQQDFVEHPDDQFVLTDS